MLTELLFFFFSPPATAVPRSSLRAVARCLPSRGHPALPALPRGFFQPRGSPRGSQHAVVGPTFSSP